MVWLIFCICVFIYLGFLFIIIIVRCYIYLKVLKLFVIIFYKIVIFGVFCVKKFEEDII